MSRLIDGVMSVFRRDPPSPAKAQAQTALAPDWQIQGLTNSLDSDYYDNVFPYVNAISQRFSTIMPYAVGPDSERIDPAPAALKALYAPNDTFSFREFLRFMASSILTQSHLDILIWTQQGRQIVPGGPVTPDNIVGYTFLPQDSRKYTDDRLDYYHHTKVIVDDVPQTMDFTRDETIALSYSAHPLDPSRGISPAMTIQSWASVDDLIADYEHGFFANGAVPSGVLNVVADSQEGFNRTVAQLKTAFRGAQNTNNIAYSYVPVDPETRKPSQIAKLTWNPFQQSNTNLDLKTISDLATQRMTKSLGTPSIIMGIDDAQTYANAQQAERIFIENTLQPLLLTVWDKFQFELDRITGGLGYGITFALDLPAQTDVERVQADTQATQVNTYLSLVNAGATPAAAAKALDLPDDFATLTVGQTVSSDTEGQTGADDSRPFDHDVDIARPSTKQVGFSADTESHGSAYEAGITASSHMLRQCVSLVENRMKMAHTPLSETSIAAEWVDSSLAAYEDEILEYAKATGKNIADSITDLAKTDEGIRRILDSYTQQQITELYDWASLPNTYEDAYRAHLRLVAKDAVHNGVNKVTQILDRADREGWIAEDTEAALTELVTGSRAESLARNELIMSQKLGSLYSAHSMSNDMGVRLEKYWKTTGPHPCPLCTELNGKAIPLDDTFMDVGDTVTVEDHTYINDFESKTTANGHPNCLCVTLYRVTGTKDGLA
ncbi:MAG: hypothetical protein [Caudoviricetes sp.]|nr:MAG: hypothetical protein [Caudoviricetes sp.]